MTNQIAAISNGVIEALVLNGDLSKMNDQQKVLYYKEYCNHLGLNPLTQPFKILNLQGKQIMYATKDCSEQLRKIHGVSVLDLEGHIDPDGTYVVTGKFKDKEGKMDVSTGVVFIDGLKGEAVANAKMKAETKCKRRGTLSICGLSVPDESEIETIDANATVTTFPSQPAKKPLGDKHFADYVVRIGKGELDLIQKLRETFLLNDQQIADLVSLEDKNTVAA